VKAWSAVDWSILHALNEFLHRNDGVEDPLVFYVNASEALFAATLVVVFLAAQGARWRDWRRAAVAAALSAGMALAIGSVISGLVDRARPFVADPGQVHLFVSHSSDPSFPSDHATASFAIAVAILLRKRGWGLVALAAATLLALGRVAVGVHYPSDVLAGATLGTVVALLLWWAPLRRRVDSLADLAGGLWDGAVSRGVEVFRRV
jgi:undecaprenyl-diphosphatase